MTFNILHASVRNPVGPWSERRALVEETIRAARPDVACLQEVSEGQLADLARNFPEYEFVPGERSGAAVFPFWAWVAAASLGAACLALGAWARRAGGGRKTASRVLAACAGAGALLSVASVLVARFVLGDFLVSGERCPVLLRKDRLIGLDRGCFWLSRDPDRAGSTLPGSPTPHLVNWVRVVDRSSGRPCRIYSTHLGVMPWAARGMAEVLFARLDRDWDGAPQILAGDFNTAPRGRLVRGLLAARGDRPPAFHDAWSEAERRDGTGRTFDFGMGFPGPRIDYVLVRPSLRVTSASTAPGRGPKRRASDHDPLIVDLETPARPR